MTKYDRSNYKFASYATNRGQLARFFVTLPRTKTKKTDLEASLPPSTYYKIAQESHKDGYPHLHAVVIPRTHSTKIQLLKRLQKAFPTISKSIDVGAIRNMEGAVSYLDKEDKKPITVGQYSVKKKDYKSKRAQKAYLKKITEDDDELSKHRSNLSFLFDEPLSSMTNRPLLPANHFNPVSVP